MKGSPKAVNVKSIRFPIVLVVAHIAAAGFIVGLLHELGAGLSRFITPTASIAVCGLAAIAGVGIDAHAARRGTYSIGLKRQTSKELGHDGTRQWWVTPLLWGIDTGLIWSTFRVPSASWVLLMGALLNVMPQWSGIVYGLFFGVPLVVAVSIGDIEKFGRAGSYPSLPYVQIAGIIVLAALPIGMVLSVYAAGERSGDSSDCWTGTHVVANWRVYEPRS